MSPSRLLLVLVSLLPALHLAGCGQSEADALAKARTRLETADTKAARIELKNLVQAHPKSGEVRLLAGHRMLLDGNAAGAAAELQRALEFGVPQSRALPLLAEALAQSGQNARVAQDHADTQLPDPEAQAWLQATVAQANFALGRQAAARAAVERALKASPNSVHARLAKARLAVADNNLADAMAQVDALVAQDPKFADAWILKADLHLATPNGRDAARQAFEQAVVARPALTGPRTALMSLLVAQGDLPGAQAQLAELHKRAPDNINTAMADGQLAFVSGDHARAREVFQGLLRVLPENVALLLTAGENEMMLGSAQQAEALFAKASALAPRNNTARRLLAKAQLRLGQAPKALATLEPLVEAPDATAEEIALAAEARSRNGEARAAQALYDRLAKLKPTDPRLRTLVASASLGRGDDSQVFAELRRIASESKGASADFALVNAHLARGQNDEALKVLDTLQAKQPKDPAPAHLRGQVLVRMRREAEARQAFEAAVRLRPGYFPAIAALAALDVREGRLDQARTRFADVIKAQPTNATAMLAMAEVLTRQGAPAKEVRAQIQAAIKAAPGDVSARVALVNHLAAANDLDAALNAALAASAAMPDNPDLLVLLARWQLRRDQASQALATYGKLAALQPRSPVPHLGMAELHMTAGKLELAARSNERALELAPNLIEARAQAVTLALHREQYAKALDMAQSMLREPAGAALGHALVGEVELQQGHWKAAAMAFQAAQDQQPSSATSMKLYQALRRDNQEAAAERHAASWLQKQPRDANFLVMMGVVAEQSGRPQQAEQRYRQALEVAPGQVQALNNLAMLLVAQGKSEGLALAERAAAAAPTRAEVLDTLAAAQAGAGKLADAVESQRRAVQLAPDQASLRLGLARLLVRAKRPALAKDELEKLTGAKLPPAEANELDRLMTELR